MTREELEKEMAAFTGDQYEDMRKDAERHRWLMRQIPATIGMAIGVGKFASDEEIAEAIDTAMTATTDKNNP